MRKTPAGFAVVLAMVSIPPAVVAQSAARPFKVGLLQIQASPPHPNESAEGLPIVLAGASKLSVTLEPVPVMGADGLETALTSIGRARYDAVYLYPSALLFRQRQRIAEFALKNRLPAIDPFSDLAHAGGLMSYGPSVSDLFRRAAEQTDRIVRGAKTTDLPVEQATRFYLALNLKTAKALGLPLPMSLLLRADQVIE